MVLMVHAGCSLGPVTYYGGMFYMPVFFVAAGYTYHHKTNESYGCFLKKKASRLLLPYVLVNGLLWLFFWLKDSVLTGHPGDWKLNSLFGILYSRNQMCSVPLMNQAGQGMDSPKVLMDLMNSPLWFLTAMFLTYAFYEAISRKKEKYLLLAIGLFLSVLWHRFSTLLLPWSMEAIPYFACFFAAGEALRERGWMNRIKEKGFWILLLAIVFVALAKLNGSVNLSIGNYGRSMLLYLIVGSTGSMLVFLIGIGIEKICRPIAALCGVIGQQTMIILCFHMFLYMFIQVFCLRLGSGEGLTRLVMVAGALVLLTAAGEVLSKRNN